MRSFPVFALGLLGLALASSHAAAAGSPLRLETLESAPALVVGEILDVEALPHAAFAATLGVERALRGEVAPGKTLRIAWEEPAPSLPSRWSSGQRILVSLGPLPTASIWKTRVPSAAEREALTAPLPGGSFDRPSSGELLGLEHYLALPASEREGAAGLVRLAQLTESASDPLSLAAVDRLGRQRGFALEWPAGTAESLARALVRRDAPRSADALLGLLTERQPAQILPALEASLARRDTHPPAILLEALGAVRGALDPALSARLLVEGSPAERLAAARFASGEDARRRLQKLAFHDPDPELRARAITRLLQLDGEASLDAALRAFGDAEMEPRRAAVYAVAKLGAEAVPRLEEFTASRGADEARNAVAALSMMGAPARPALARIAETHEDAGVRAMARMAIGLPIGHED